MLKMYCLSNLYSQYMYKDHRTCMLLLVIVRYKNESLGTTLMHMRSDSRYT